MLKPLHRIAMVLLVLAFASSCGRTARVYQPPPEAAALQGRQAAYPQTAFVVLSDLHVYDPSLGVTGSAFQAYLDKDRKLLKESVELLDAAIAGAAAETADFVIVCGDLTKDGEKTDHLLVARKLAALAASGKKVFVVPGNHDIANADAVRFQGDRSEPVASISGAEFAEIYGDFGYHTALDRDPASLSYLAEPVPGLWLLAVDSCKWKQNRPGHHSHTDGAYSPETFRWVESTLMRARKLGKPVIVFQHHGIMEHYPYNAKYYSDYLVDDFEAVSDMLSTWGVSLVFTGHFHAQDISRRTFDDGRRAIYDIETGSTVTAPCPYRRVLIRDGKADVESRFIRAIPSHPTGFRQYADNYVYQGTIKLADAALKKYKVSRADREKFNPQISRAYVTHLAGDEVMPATVIDTDGASLWGKFVIFMQENLLYGWYSEMPPADNRLTIDLVSGKSE